MENRRAFHQVKISCQNFLTVYSGGVTDLNFGVLKLGEYSISNELLSVLLALCIWSHTNFPIQFCE